MEIRPASAHDIARLQAIEVAAGRAFVDVGRPEIAADDPPSIEDLAEYVADGRAWVVGEPPDAYVIVDLLDGVAHVEQVSVHPEAGGQRLGARLIDHVSAWAGDLGHDRLTLTTFRDVPWNAPYYERLGFTVVADEVMGPELRQRIDEEHEHGLLRSDRVAMTRPTIH